MSDDLLKSSSDQQTHQGSHNFMCTIQNPSSHTEEVSGIIKQMWVDSYRKLTSRYDCGVTLFVRHSRYYV